MDDRLPRLLSLEDGHDPVHVGDPLRLAGDDRQRNQVPDAGRVQLENGIVIDGKGRVGWGVVLDGAFELQQVSRVEREGRSSGAVTFEASRREQGRIGIAGDAVGLGRVESFLGKELAALLLEIPLEFSDRVLVLVLALLGLLQGTARRREGRVGSDRRESSHGDL